MYFLSRPERDGARAVEWQGKILRQIRNGVFLVQLYSWASGEATSRALVTEARITEEEWFFYATLDDWHDAAERLRR